MFDVTHDRISIYKTLYIAHTPVSVCGVCVCLLPCNTLPTHLLVCVVCVCVYCPAKHTRGPASKHATYKGPRTNTAHAYIP